MNATTNNPTAPTTNNAILDYVKGQYEALFKLNGWIYYDEEVSTYRDIMRRFMPEEEFTDFMNDMYAKYHK